MSDAFSIHDPFERFTLWAGEGGKRVPIIERFTLEGESPVSAFHKIHRGPYGFLLESCEGPEQWARYSFIATEPAAVLRYRGRIAERWTSETGWSVDAQGVSPFEHLAAAVRESPGVDRLDIPHFCGGAVGYMGWETVHSLERLPGPPPDDRQIPDAVFMLCEQVLVLDREERIASLVATPYVPPGPSTEWLRECWEAARARMTDWRKRLDADSTLEDTSPRQAMLPEPESAYPRDQFRKDVDRIREYIAAGDTFQTVLSRRFDLPAADPLAIYDFLWQGNPSPYHFFLHCDDVHVVGSSPEALVRVSRGAVTMRPIAGTRPRGETDEEDAALEAELRADPKEQAEHVMLVDLARNDVGRVAEYGSVEVPQYMEVERYSHVMHLVSEVRGRLREGLDAMDAFMACFPAGTVSGAPKVRAMEIITEIEPVRRGPYAGAVGHIGWGGAALDTAITIRTAVIRGENAWVQAGAGIVADSDPEAEASEVDAKARAVVTAIGLAGSLEQ